jgi:hypothetical protein
MRPRAIDAPALISAIFQSFFLQPARLAVKGVADGHFGAQKNFENFFCERHETHASRLIARVMRHVDEPDRACAKLRRRGAAIINRATKWITPQTRRDTSSASDSRTRTPAHGAK